MYKLVVIAGKLRGKEYNLQEGENIIGRSEEATINIAVQGVSKKHLSLSVSGGTVFIEDLGSANGTFLNGKHVTRSTIKNKDKIALPNLILQLVYVKEKKIIIEKKLKVEKETDEYSNPTVPDNLPGKIIHFFKYKLMNVVYGINQEYEWKSLLGIFITIFAICTITATILPVMNDSKRIIINEIALRGKQFADEIGRVGAQALQKGNLDNIDTSFLDGTQGRDKGIHSYVVFDAQGRIVRPFESRNEYISDTFHIDVRKKLAENTRSDDFAKVIEGSKVGVGKKIIAFNNKTGELEPVGFIAIKFAPESLKAAFAQNSRVYFESLITSFLVATFFYGVVYFLTIRPLSEFHHQVEECLRGNKKNVDLKHMMMELFPLKSTINSMLVRIRELQNEELDSEFVEAEPDDSYVATLTEFMHGANGPVVVLDSGHNVARVNEKAEDLLSMRESSAQGGYISDHTKDKDTGDAILLACSNSEANSGTSQEELYSIGGVEFKIFATALMGSDNMAKAYYVTFVEDS